MSAISLVLLLLLCDFAPTPGQAVEIFFEVFAFRKELNKRFRAAPMATQTGRLDRNGSQTVIIRLYFTCRDTLKNV